MQRDDAGIAGIERELVLRADRGPAHARKRAANFWRKSADVLPVPGVFGGQPAARRCRCSAAEDSHDQQDGAGAKSLHRGAPQVFETGLPRFPSF